MANENGCMNLGQQRCLQNYDQTSTDYETCMMDFWTTNGLNETMFCDVLYTNETLWLSSNIVFESTRFIERKYNCYEQSGIEKDKTYCDEI